MDDLESFFYVWCHVTFLYDGDRPMQPTSSHPELKAWNYTWDIAARSKRSFLLDDNVPMDTPLNYLDADTRVLVFKLMNSLRDVIVPTLRSHGRAVGGQPGALPVPMDVFESWEDYKTSAEQAYGDFLRPVNEAINTLKATHRNWNKRLRGPPTVDTRASEFATGVSSPTLLVTVEDWSRAGSSLSFPLELSTHTSRSSKRPRSPIDDEHTSLEDDGTSAGSSGVCSLRAKRARRS